MASLSTSRYTNVGPAQQSKRELTYAQQAGGQRLLSFIMTPMQLSQPLFYDGSSKGAGLKMVSGIEGSSLKLTKFLYLNVLLVLT